MKRFIGLLIVATSLAFPAFAQSFDPDNGTGNLVAGGITVAAPARTISTPGSRTLGEEAYALSSRRKVNLDIELPNADNSGGGSPGYNEMLRNW
jgi:hypothetical protein